MLDWRKEGTKRGQVDVAYWSVSQNSKRAGYFNGNQAGFFGGSDGGVWRHIENREQAIQWIEKQAAQWLKDQDLTFAIPWRSVDDELPDYESECCVCIQPGNGFPYVWFGGYDEHGEFVDEDGLLCCGGEARITHWCYTSDIPLPAPRAEVSDE